MDYISYRHIHYNARKKAYRLWTWDKNTGERIIIDKPFKPYLYIETADQQSSNANSIYNTPLRKIQFDNSFERNKYVKESGIKRIFYNLPIEQQVLIDEFGKENSKQEFSQYPLKVFSLDIETYSPAEFPDPMIAKDTINLITVHDSLTDTYHTWGLEHDFYPKEDNIKYYQCVTETDLLRSFIRFWRKDFPDIVTGWNCLTKNQYLWTPQKIIDLSKNCENIPLFTSDFKKNRVNIYMDTGVKKEIEIKTELGHSILCSENHIFPIFSKDKLQYKNANTLLKTKKDIKVKDINQNKDSYVFVPLRNNDNINLSLRQCIIENWETYKNNNRFNFKIKSIKIKKYLEVYKDKIDIRQEYWQGKSFWKKRGWDYKHLKSYIPDGLILEYLKEESTLTCCLTNKFIEINLDEIIEDDVLRMLGYTFTDGCVDFKSFTNQYSSKYNDLVEKYTSIYNHINKKQKVKLSRQQKSDNNFYKRISCNNILGVLLPLIYNNENKKQLNITALSQLSHNQFISFFGGLIDGDGNISNSQINICNYDKCYKIPNVNILQQLLLWNGVISSVTKNNVGIPYLNENIEFIENLNIWHTERNKKINLIKYFSKKNTSSNKIKWFKVERGILVKIKSISETGKAAEMCDIETTTHYFTCNGILTHNCEGFDIPYLINRINNVLGGEAASALSPVDDIYKRENVLLQFGKMGTRWHIRGLSIIDYMDAYMTFSRAKQESYKLDHIGEVELGKGKLAYNATSLSDLANKNWKQFVEYNIQDVRIIVELEKKLQFLMLVRMLAYLGMTNFEAALGTVSIVTGALALQALSKGMIIPTFPKNEVEPYDGGFVKIPQKGLHEAVVSFDANSLYPNTIITLNISPETKVGKILKTKEDSVELLLSNDKRYTLTLEQFKKFITQQEIAISKANILFSQKHKGFCPELVDIIYADRVRDKKELKSLRLKRNKLLAELKALENNPHIIVNKNMGTKEEIEKELNGTDKRINDLDILQFTKKILLNRLYGTFANKYSPFCDVDIASSITLTGQAVVKQAAEIGHEFAKNNGLDEDINIYSDTDSIYISFKNLLKHKGIDLTESGRVTKSAYLLIEDFEKYLNTSITTWAQQTLNTKDSRFLFKREAICDAAIFFEKKKRYILHILDDEGIACNKTKYTGVEVASTGTPAKVKPLIKKIVKTVLETKDYHATQKAYREAFDKFKKLDITGIAFPRGIKNLEEYASKADGFAVGKGTPIHCKAAIYYNKLIKDLGIDNKYETIHSGDKIKFFYTDKNKYGISVIGFLQQYPTEFGLTADYEKMFEKTVFASVERLYDALGWRVVDLQEEPVNDLLALLS